MKKTGWCWTPCLDGRLRPWSWSPMGLSGQVTRSLKLSALSPLHCAEDDRKLGAWLLQVDEETRLGRSVRGSAHAWLRVFPACPGVVSRRQHREPGGPASRWVQRKRRRTKGASLLLTISLLARRSTEIQKKLHPLFVGRPFWNVRNRFLTEFYFWISLLLAPLTSRGVDGD